MTVAELLKSKGIADEVAAGLPKEVVAAFTGYVSEADTKYQGATSAAAEAAESLRQAELERKEIGEYVEKSITSITANSALEAREAALNAGIAKMKEKGFDMTGVIPEPAAKPAVPGSPAIGGNVDAVRNLASATAQFLDANNEHIRLYGEPLPDSAESLSVEAARARKPIGEFIGEKYKFGERKTAKAAEARQKEIDKEVNAKVTEMRKADAEARGNPNLRPGEASRNSFVKKIQSDEFHKSDGHVPKGMRHQRMLGKIHQEIEAEKSA